MHVRVCARTCVCVHSGYKGELGNWADGKERNVGVTQQYATSLKHSSEDTGYPHYNVTKTFLSSHGAFMRHNIDQIVLVLKTKMNFSVFVFLAHSYTRV